MYTYNVMVNESFKDRYTNKIYKPGDKINDLSEERVNEIKAVKSGLISIVSKKEAKTKNTKED